MLQVNFVSMGSEQRKAYNNALNDYRAITEARGEKSLVPKRQISNYFTQLRKVSISCGAKFSKISIFISNIFHCSTDCKPPLAYKAHLQ
jgi:hypothetical protein